MKTNQSKKKLKYQWDDSTHINPITGNYYWSDGIQSTFVSCGRKAGIKDIEGYGRDFTEFWNDYQEDYSRYVHPSKIREVIHWFFEKSELKNEMEFKTSREFLDHYFEIIKAMNKSCLNCDFND